MTKEDAAREDGPPLDQTSGQREHAAVRTRPDRPWASCLLIALLLLALQLPPTTMLLKSLSSVLALASGALATYLPELAASTSAINGTSFPASVDLLSIDLKAISELLQNQTITSVQLVTEYLARIELVSRAWAPTTWESLLIPRSRSEQP